MRLMERNKRQNHSVHPEFSITSHANSSASTAQTMDRGISFTESQDAQLQTIIQEEPNSSTPDKAIENTNTMVEDEPELVPLLQKELTTLKESLKTAENRASDLESKLSKLRKTKLSLDVLKENSKIVPFYTGLPNLDTLMLVFEHASKSLPFSNVHGNKKLSNFSDFLLMIVKLRLDLKNKDLGFRFGVSECTVTET